MRDEERQREDGETSVIALCKMKRIPMLMKDSPHFQMICETTFFVMIYFQLLYIQVIAEFSLAITLAPLIFYSSFCIVRTIVEWCNDPEGIESGALYDQVIVNWLSLLAFLVFNIIN